MPGVTLYDYQLDAVNRMKNGCVLCGGVGSGKSRTALAYFYRLHGGVIGSAHYIKMREPIQDLYIITTARKRDTFEWDGELGTFFLSTRKDTNLYGNAVTVDSWNNIRKYKDIAGAFFLFDEQRVVGHGAWVKSFLKIAKNNQWVLLSATPGDTWQDYIPVFIANGFFKNRAAFNRDHAVFSKFTNFPKVEKYIGTGRLIRLRNDILVNMDFERETTAHHERIDVEYNVERYKELGKTRWNPYTNQPVQNAAELCYLWRRIVNEDFSRQMALRTILEEHPKAIIFYNFDYELELLKVVTLGSERYQPGEVAEWNGHRHEPIPKTEKWAYLVQYTAGCEGWNCTQTDTIIFYSQNYSYKVMTQAAGRIDRLNTPFTDLWYYHLKSKSGIDLAIGKALKEKRNFNERGFAKW